MKAVVLAANEKLIYQEVPLPAVGPDQVRIKVAVCGICGSDIPRVFDHGAHSYPIILGHEFSGAVDAVGQGVEGLALGTHVTAAPLVPCHSCEDCLRGDYSLCDHYSFIGSRQQGAMAEYVVVPKANIVVLPEDISFEQAATIEPSTVALHAFRLISYTASKNVAVLGCGIIGLYAIQWAKLLGAKKVVALGHNDNDLKAALAAGADEFFSTLDMNDDDLLDRLDAGGYEYVMECVGAEQTIRLSLEMVAKKGTVCMIGTPKKSLSFTPAGWESINRKECWVTGSWMSYSSPFPGEEWCMTTEYMKSGKLKMISGMIRGVYPMARAAEAFADVRNSSGGRCLLKN